ncbi:MAG: pyruvate, phosphate dikinase [Clostridium sp.]|nr:pyruvate, phosphate dikinase [Clostridium sp.]
MKYIFNFTEGSKDMKHILGGKGANLAEMTNIGLPVPSGFTISTEACSVYYNNNKSLTPEIMTELNENIDKLEAMTGKKLGCPNNPLLLSVRSGSVFSMPGMMDTILNLGLNDEVVEGLAKSTNNERFAYDSYRRFIQMFSDVAMDLPRHQFDSILERVKRENGYTLDTEITVEDFKYIISEFKSIYKTSIGEEFPTNPREQLILAINAVFKSWNNPRAILYRNLNDIDHNLGTAVNIQSMVFGNMGNTSGTGVAFTRNPVTGEKKLFGEYLINAQGEDVVAGIRTPQDIETLKNIMPNIYEQFVNVTNLLESHYKDMQDIEFTIENEKLYILQTRNGKRTAHSAVKIAVDLVNENLLTKEEAIMKIEPKQLDQLLHPSFDKEALKSAKLIATGLPASPGASTGKVCFTSEDVVANNKMGIKTILARPETSPEDIEGMLLSEGTLTSRGGMTSHASVVARGMGKCCVAGCSQLNICEESKVITIGDITIKEGDVISLDGSTGNVYLGEVEKSSSSISEEFDTLMQWVDEIKTMQVRANADNKRDSETAVKFGAEGIGLCRTEHMFFEEDRIPVMRQMILSNNTRTRQVALDKLMEMQIADFEEIFETMDGRNVNIRLLDPPLHEFLPKEEETIEELSKMMDINVAVLKERIENLHEFNPMLGHRGCRLVITYPEIATMQAKAIIYGAINTKRKGIEVNPEIMVPLVGDKKELSFVKEYIVSAIEEVLREEEISISYQVGTMIEVPRACVTADEIAQEAEFFSFGTNDLTQMTFAYSRDDSGKFINEYMDKSILEKSPFETLDTTGVGKLMSIATDLGRKTRPNIKIGICGEHGGDPASIEFCASLGFNYVSCSPYRIPIARLACAQAEIIKKMNK